ncbi:unnamed protein product [Strongylus vulgaris]|uniref:Uncharacterized protein n=1 Tax=Strongylus vulgaris TaxID=40348 RepID=A0A3P7LLE0_STRVU|nr:unnamed protein product [Strongylus vulgaris]
MRSLFVIIVLAAIIQAASSYNRYSDVMQIKRDIKPDWEDLGWAWGKRSAPDDMVNVLCFTHVPFAIYPFQYHRRFLRSMQLVKKNPDWHDLGWTWGRRK